MVQLGGGKIGEIRGLKDLPNKVLEGLIEGVSTNPADFVVLGMGFVIGYEGLDLMEFFTAPFRKMLGDVGDALKGFALKPLEWTLPLATIPIEVLPVLDDIWKLASGATLTTGKHITPASKIPQQLGPGVSKYGPPPTGWQGYWGPYGTTLSNLADEIEKAPEEDKAKLQLELILAEQKIKLLMGCVGALTAYGLTRPGVAQALIGTVGEVIQGALQGAGEAVPL